MWIDNDLDI